jgi:pilus assembly protein TadC
MRKRKIARTTATEPGLQELLDRLELALIDLPARAPVGKALTDLNRRLGSDSGKAVERRRRTAVESLPLF